MAGWSIAVWSVVSAKIYEQVTTNGMPNGDAGVFATIGVAILHGRVPYRDLWDHKPPGIYYTDALVFSHLAPWAYHLVEVPVGLALVAAFYWLARIFASRPIAALGSALCAFLATTPLLELGGNLTETYLLLPLVLAYGLGLRYCFRGVSDNRRSAAWLYRSPGTLVGVGLCSAGAALMKPQALVDLALIEGAIMLSWYVTRDTLRQSWKRGLAHLAVAPAVCGVLCGGVILALSVVGAGSAMWTQLIDYNAVYAHAVGVRDAISLMLGSPFGLIVWGLGASAAATLCANIFLRNTKDDSTENTAISAVILGWWLLGILEVAADRHFWQHDFLLSMPACAAIVTLALSRAWAPASAKSLLRRGIRVTLGAGLVSTFTFIAASNALELGKIDHLAITPASAASWSVADRTTQPTRYGIVQLGGLALTMQPSLPSADELLAEKIVAITHPYDQVFIWGSPTGAYVLSGRRPASRFLYDLPITNTIVSGPASLYDVGPSQHQLMRDLTVSAPRLIVVQVAGGIAGPPIPPLKRLLRSHYRRSAETFHSPPGLNVNYVLYLRIPGT